MNASLPTRRQRRVRIWLIGLAVFATLGVGLGWLWYFRSTRELAYDLVRARNSRPGRDRSVPDDITEHIRVPGADDGVELDVWVIEPRQPRPRDSVDWVVILHGIADEKRTLIGLGRRFANHGVGAILVDLRGHGLSTQDRITFGARDVHDLSGVLDALEEREYRLGEVGAYGPSYGGAIALQLAAHDTRVRRAVSVGGFASFREIVRPLIEQKQREWAWLIPGFFVDTMVDVASGHAGFRPRDASPRISVAGEHNARFLIVHSRADDVVPFAHAETLTAACGSRCESLFLDGFDHLGSLSNQPLRERLHLFLEGQPLSTL